MSAPRVRLQHSEDVGLPEVRNFLVTFHSPTPIGATAASMEIEAETVGDALRIWREATGFLGATATEPVVTEILS